MRTIDDLLEANQIDKTTHRFLSQTAKQNSWGKMYLLPKVHKLSPEEITQAETHSLKSLNKTLPGRPIIAQCGSPTYYIGKLIDILIASTHCQKIKHIQTGYPALHTNDRVTPGIPELHPSGIRLHVNVHKYGVQ